MVVAVPAQPRLRLEAANAPLFVPGNRPDRYASAESSGTDLVILDLEDAVPADQKETARANAVEWVEAGHPAAVRVNAIGTAWHDGDVAALAVIDLPVVVVVPKSEPGQAFGRITHLLPTGSTVLALLETARGVQFANDIATADGVARLAFGNFDLAAELGVDPSDSAALATARSLLVLTSAAAGLPGPVDGVTAALRNQRRLADDTEHARRMGFTGKLCIHPSQVPTVLSALRPTDREIEWSRAILASSRDGVSVLDGQMIDAPVIRRAELIAQRASGDAMRPVHPGPDPGNTEERTHHGLA